MQSMANHGQARRDHKSTRTGNAVVVEAQPETSVAGKKDDWQPIPGTQLYARNGEGIYERLADGLFIRMDDVDEKAAEKVVARLKAAFAAGDATPGRAGDVPAEKETREILDRLERRLGVQEALTAELMQRYGLAV
jgi:hypothetical protein